MKYAYYPGCSQEGGEEHFGKSTEAVCHALGIELQEIHEWTCCGASLGTSSMRTCLWPSREICGRREDGAGYCLSVLPAI
jgi:heterodisulfide reductase subunit B